MEHLMAEVVKFPTIEDVWLERAAKQDKRHSAAEEEFFVELEKCVRKYCMSNHVERPTTEKGWRDLFDRMEAHGKL